MFSRSEVTVHQDKRGAFAMNPEFQLLETVFNCFQWLRAVGVLTRRGRWAQLHSLMDIQLFGQPCEGEIF